MPLPLCVRVDWLDGESAAALRRSGWREVGCLVEFSGFVYGGEPDKRIRFSKRASPSVALARRLHWRGRLARDASVPVSVAAKEMETVIRKAARAGRLAVCSNGFIIVERSGGLAIVRLIGVKAGCRRRGVASALLRFAARCVQVWSDGGNVRAGTYSDNREAIALYRSVGMIEQRRRLVFHK